MNKSALVVFLTAGSLISVIPGLADNNQTGDNKVVKASKLGRGIMWGPKKIGNGMKTMSEKTKNAFHKSSKPQTTK